MEPDFWHERWARGEIGFHQPEINTHLQLYFNRLEIRSGAHILVPLCGKSLDMLYLREKDCRVSGIEISRVAVTEFFEENGIHPEIRDHSGLTLYRSENLEIYCGDFFTGDFSKLNTVDAVYDRASLIALPPDMRAAYVDRLSGLLPGATRTLLLTLEYPQQEMQGPPFSVTRTEIEKLYGSRYEIEHILAEDCLASEPRFREKGLSRFDAHVYVMRKD
jgi:thiopurine S-methyltransferase